MRRPLARSSLSSSKVLFRCTATSAAELPSTNVPNDEKHKKHAAELTLDLLEWPRLLHIVSSFAGTASAKKITKDFTLPLTYHESECLLLETTAAIDLLSFLGNSLDFGGIHSTLVSSCLVRLGKGFVMNGQEAVAMAMLLQFTNTIQHDIRVQMEHSMNLHNVLKVLLDQICRVGIQPEVTKAISKTMDEDGNVKDSASADLQRARVQYHSVESKIQELLRSLLREQEGSASTQQVDGRFCIAVSSDNQKHIPGLLLKSGESGGSSISYIEPVALVSLNDKLAEAKASILKAEYEALRYLTKKLLPHLEDLSSLLEALTQLDVIVARAKFSLKYEGSRPIFTTYGSDYSHVGLIEVDRDAKPPKGMLVKLRQAYHPLLLHQHREHARILKTKNQRKKKEAAMSISPPVPIDIMVSRETRVITITGPNTGGKTAAMKTLGLAALMAKSGLYVIAKEPAYLPWFDAVLADIGDEQSLIQSLSTFSGHLRRINHIKESSTGESLVLLDEVGTGTNPIEGAALGMAILESFAQDRAGGARLTIASTHHAELKTMKYSDSRFENASVEFDEETLKPTYRLLWGIPGRSNALNIAGRLGVPKGILNLARGHLGVANTEINQVILDLERSKQSFENDLFEAEQHTKKSKQLYQKLKEATELLEEEEGSAVLSAASILQEQAHEARASLTATHLKRLSAGKGARTPPHKEGPSPARRGTVASAGEGDNDGDGKGIPEVGEMVFVPGLGKEAQVVCVLTDRKTVLVQSGPLQLRLALSDVLRCYC